MKKYIINAVIGLFALLSVSAQEYTTNEVTVVTDTNNYIVNVTNFVVQHIPSTVPVTVTNTMEIDPTFLVNATSDITTHIANGTAITTTNYSVTPTIIEQWKVDYFFNVWTANNYHIHDPMGNNVPLSAKNVKEIVLFRLEDGSDECKYRLTIK